MLCDLCNKNAATVHIQEVIGDTQKAIHLCQDCASAQNPLGNDADGLKLAALICKIATKQFDTGSGPAEDDGEEGIVCSGCGMSESEYREGGRLGCEECYDSFADMILSVIQEGHHGCEHRGKTPGMRAELAPPTPEPAELDAIEDELARAVAEEQYERAAELRDALVARRQHVDDA